MILELFLEKSLYNVQDKQFIENSANSILTYDDFSLG